MPVANKLQDLKNQQKRLAEVLTSKGIPATATEKYDSLVDKVTQLEELRGEERTLTNIVSVLSKPESIVQLEYPIDNIIVPPYVGLTSTTSGITATVNADNSVTFNGTTTAIAMFNFKNIAKLDIGTYTFSVQVPTGCHYTLGKIENVDTDVSHGNITVTSVTTGSYWLLSFPEGMVLDNVKIRQPILYKVPAPKILNAKLGSKNLTTPQQVYEGAAAYSEELYENKNCVRFSSSTTIKNSPVAFKPNTQYTVSFDVKTVLRSGQTTAGEDAVFCFFYDDNTLSIICNTYTQPVWQHKVLTSIIDKTVVAVGLASREYRSYSYVDIDSFQLEESSTATSYTPYITDFSSVSVTACGKNLLKNPNVHTYNYSADFKKYNSADEIFLPVGTYSISASKNMPTLQFWNKETKAYYTVDEVVSAYSTNTYYKVYDGRALGRASDAVNRMYFTLKKEALITLNSGVSTGTTVQCQLELGSTVTTYEPYQGQTYTPTATGEVIGIANLYPTTTLITDNAGVVFTKVLQSTQGNEFTEILPSTGKNGITKVNQPIIDSSVDDNIKPENIKKGVKILGVLGTYEGN
jgi:hypothetical protein